MVDFSKPSPDPRGARWWAQKPITKEYRDGWDKIFAKKPQPAKKRKRNVSRKSR